MGQGCRNGSFENGIAAEANSQACCAGEKASRASKQAGSQASKRWQEHCDQDRWRDCCAEAGRCKR
jgi:hypothetical protein